MTAAVAISNLILGAAYTTYGVLTIIEMKRGWKTMGFSHLGAAWITMAFTCGPHHLAHGLHAAVEGRSGGPLDLYAVVVGLPFGVIWLFLRIEAMLGGPGDRTFGGTPWLLKAMPTLGAVYLTTLVFTAAPLLQGPKTVSAFLMPNILLLGIYMAIGVVLLRTQLRNHAMGHNWSLSGLTLTGVFPTCGIMHLIFGLYGVSGRYRYDVHGFLIDWVGVPAGLYFLWVVRSLYRGSLKDWNVQTPQRPAMRAVS